MSKHIPYILSHYWDADGEVSRWFFDLYKMKGGVNGYEEKWNMTLNHQDIERLKEVNNIDNRFFDNSVKLMDGGVSLIICNHAPRP